MEGLAAFLKKVRGKRVAIGGSRNIDAGTFRAVRTLTGKLLRGGYSIVTGGAEGVDHAVMRACLGRGAARRLLIFLPTTIDGQYAHYRRLGYGMKARALRRTLERIKKACPAAIRENRGRFRNYRAAANRRNSLIIRAASGFAVFMPRRSPGTRDALAKIEKSGKPHLVVG